MFLHFGLIKPFITNLIVAFSELERLAICFKLQIMGKLIYTCFLFFSYLPGGSEMGWQYFKKLNSNCYYCIFLEGLTCRIHSLLAKSRALADQLTNQGKCINHKFNCSWMEPLHLLCILNVLCKMIGWKCLFIKKILYSILFYSIYLFIYWPHHTAYRISVPRPGIEPGLRQWKPGIQTTRPPGKPHFFFF